MDETESGKISSGQKIEIRPDGEIYSNLGATAGHSGKVVSFNGIVFSVGNGVGNSDRPRKKMSSEPATCASEGFGCWFDGKPMKYPWTSPDECSERFYRDRSWAGGSHPMQAEMCIMESIPKPEWHYTGMWTDTQMGPYMKFGVEDMGIGHICNHVVYYGGFCGGDAVGRYPPSRGFLTLTLIVGDAFGCRPRGFQNSAFVLDLDAEAKGKGEWVQIDDFPFPPRQSGLCGTVGNAMYCGGGFNYEPLSDEEIRKDRSALFKPKRAVKTFQNGARLTCKKVGGKVIQLPSHVS